MEILLDTNAFIAHRTMEGILIQSKNKAVIMLGLSMLGLGLLCFILYFFMKDVHLPRRWMEWLFDPTMLYSSYVAAGMGVFFLLKGILFKKGKPVLFDRHTKELTIRFEKIPFREIENIRYVAFPFIGGELINLKFTHKRLTKTFIYIPSIVKSTSEVDTFIKELNELIRNSGY